MEILNSAREFLLGFVMVVMAIILILALIRAIIGPRFTDRIVAINMIGTEVIIIICVLAYLIGEQYLVDVALVYAMISFLAVVVMVNLYLTAYREKTLKSKEEAEILSHEHGIEVGREEYERRQKASMKAEGKEGTQ